MSQAIYHAEILYPVNTTAHCPNCDDLIFKFCKNIYKGEKMALSQIYKGIGQPQYQGKQLACEKCEILLEPKKIKFVKPEEEF